MIPAVRLTPETLADFERHLAGRGCYARSTLRTKASLARSLELIFSDTGLPLDEDAAIDQIRETTGPGRHRRSLNTAVRDLIAFCRTTGAPEVPA